MREMEGRGRGVAHPMAELLGYTGVEESWWNNRSTTAQA